jgi:hypothetical protein
MFAYVCVRDGRRSCRQLELSVQLKKSSLLLLNSVNWLLLPIMVSAAPQLHCACRCGHTLATLAYIERSLLGHCIF